ncbi:unnamed protein product [Taenia asiatica]|uniref:SH2 domain-containing protein n=1 Tax=Taenia asiatica TaxID=60517 RepID=A0A0R3WER5_TAEAS|nr:unnamed protein product [Taenia asiatica]
MIKEGDEMKPMTNARPAVMYQEVETKKRIQSGGGRAKSPPQWTTNCDNKSDLECSRQNGRASDLTDSKKKDTYGRLKSDITKCLDEIEGAAPCKQDPPPKANKSVSCKEREEAKSSKAMEQAGAHTLKHMGCAEDPQSDNFYDLYEEAGIEEEKFVTNKSSNSQKSSGIEAILNLLRGPAGRLRSNRRVSRRLLSWRASASANTQRNKDSTGKKDKNDKCKHKNACTPGISHEAPQHERDTSKAPAHDEVKYESEWNANAEYEYDEMIEYEQQLTKEYPNGMDPNADDDLYDDIVPKDDSQAMRPTVHKPPPKIGDIKHKFIENKPSSVGNLKDMKKKKSLDAKKDCRKQGSEALGDEMPGGDDGGEIYMNAELFRSLPDKVKSDSPPPIPPKMSQVTPTYGNEKKKSKVQAARIPNRQHSGIFDTLKRRQPPLTRTILPTKKHSARRKRVTRMLGLCPMKPKREKKPVPTKGVKEPQTNAEPHVERLSNDKIGIGIPYEEGEYEEYCYASELVYQSELYQQAHQDKPLYGKERPSVAEPKKFEKNSNMLSTLGSYVNEDYYEDPETSPSRISTYRQEKSTSERRDVLESQMRGGETLQTPKLKRHEDVQKVSDRRLPAPPIPVSEPTVGIKTKAPTSTDSPIVRANQSFPQIKQQEKKQVPEEPPKGSPSAGRRTSPNDQPPKSETTQSSDSTKEDLLMLPTEAKANPDASPAGPKSASQSKAVPRIPPRPHYIPQFLLLKLANSTEVNKEQERPPTPEATEQQTNQEREQVNQEQEQTNSGFVEAEELSENQPATLENQDSTCSDETALVLECENDLYMQLEDCY